METENGTFEGKVYAAKDKERNETTMRGMTSVMIMRRDKKLAWMVMPVQKMYQEMDFAKAQEQSGSKPADVAACDDDVHAELQRKRDDLIRREKAIVKRITQLVADRRGNAASALNGKRLEVAGAIWDGLNVFSDGAVNGEWNKALVGAAVNEITDPTARLAGFRSLAPRYDAVLQQFYRQSEATLAQVERFTLCTNTLPEWMSELKTRY